jgi:bisphosphoglycerate-independent phosphoglycerate mutase (AlkP superfamily)
MYAAIPLAATSAGLPLLTAEDLHAGQAISADFTAQGWRDHLGLPDTPVLSPFQAGERLAILAQKADFSLFEYWLSDYAGHGQEMKAAVELLGTFDQVLTGLLSAWDDQAGLILITSDHGNLEDLSTRRHTANPVPALVIGAPDVRRRFVAGLRDLTDVYPAIVQYVAG